MTAAPARASGSDRALEHRSLLLRRTQRDPLGHQLGPSGSLAAEVGHAHRGGGVVPRTQRQRGPNLSALIAVLPSPAGSATCESHDASELASADIGTRGGRIRE
jgi:hypothetical protein